MKWEEGNTYIPSFAIDASINETKVRIDFE